MPLWTGRPVNADPSFLPDPVMSYSNSYGLELPEDDTVPVSLLYPAPGFSESRGSVRGRILLGERPAAFAYVQSVRPGEPGEPARPGPGTFADEDGRFHLEGLSPGNWMLWVHPILVTRRNAHPMTPDADAAGASEFLDHLRWVRVEANEVLEDIEIVVHPGRRGDPVMIHLARGIATGLVAVGTLSLAGCTGSSTPATPPPAPAPAPAPAPPAPPPPEPLDPCTGVSLRVGFLGQGDAAEIARGELTLLAADPEVGLHFVKPYTIEVPEGGANLDVPGLRPTVGVFVSDLAFAAEGDGFRQTMTLEWISELEVRAGTAGCEPVTVSCDLRGCAGS